MRLRPHVLVIACSVTAASAADWPCWRGPDRNGISLEKGWSPAALARSAKKAWTADIGAGYSSVAVARERVFTFGNKANNDLVQSLEEETGKQVWQYPRPRRASRYPGPRSTPAVDGSSVYVLDRDGLLICLDAGTGEPRWTVKLGTAFAAKPLHWGFACSPLVTDNALIVNINNHGAALDKKTGKKLWTSPSGKSGYASPVPFVHGGKPRFAVFSPSALCGVDPEAGRLLWSYPWSTKHDANAADPIVTGNRAFVSTSYGRGCALLDISGTKPKVLWENKKLQAHTGTPVLLDGHIYGFSGDIRHGTPLLCLDINTGHAKWTRRMDGTGSLIAADGKLIVLTAKGDLVIVPASPNGYQELARAKVISEGKCWSAPVLANGRIYCRSNQGKLVCVDVGN